jgi:large subunit ribosomal protein L17
MAVVREKTVVHKVFEEAANRFGTINGGYTRIVKIGRRAGDAAPLTIVELYSSDVAAPTKKKKAKSRSQAKPVAAPESKKTPAAAPEAPAAAVTQPPEPAAAAPEPEASPADAEAEKDPRPGAGPNESGK